MRFGIDAHAIGRHLTGNEVYVRNLLEQYDGLDRDNQFFAYVSMPGADELVPERFEKRWVSNKPFPPIRLRPIPRRKAGPTGPVARTVHRAAALPSAVVVSVHDVSYLEHPEFSRGRAGSNCAGPSSGPCGGPPKWSRSVSSSRAGIARAYGMNPEKIAVVPAACAEIFRPQPRAQAQAFVEGRFSIRSPYILCVGDLQPRKNPIGLIRAFEELVANYPQLTHKLVFVGKRYLVVAPRVHRDCGSVAVRKPDSLHRLRQRRRAFAALQRRRPVRVPLLLPKGFGIPLLEAMACGVRLPVRTVRPCRRWPARRRIGSTPYSTREMVVAMRDLLLDPDYRAEMGHRGRENAARCSWRQRTSRPTLDLYHGVVEQAKRRAQGQPACIVPAPARRRRPRGAPRSRARYQISWPSGLSLGEGRAGRRKRSGRWQLALTLRSGDSRLPSR
jgi:glycosyltransferase involved in cell wall biosynthesis